MAPKFGVRKRVVGSKGPKAGVHGTIINRIKVGNANLLDVRWDTGDETRLTTAFIHLEDGVAGNGRVADNRGVGPGGQIVEGNVEDIPDNISERSESSEDSDGEDLGDLDGFNCIIL